MLPGETINSGASPTCNDCGQTPALQVSRSNAGYYIGTYCNCGPYSRESVYYNKISEEEMQWLLDNDRWTRRS